MTNRQRDGFNGVDRLNRAFELLGMLLERRIPNPLGLVICGGSALLALGLIPRATKDVDIVCLIEDGKLIAATKLPGALMDAARLAALELDLPKDWLNPGPAMLLNEALPNQGLPSGFQDRLVRRDYGPVLSIFLSSRVDQVYFKLYAAADKGGPSVHFADLVGLQPTDDELVGAAAWARRHDPSPAFLDTIREMLAAMEKTHVIHRL